MALQTNLDDGELEGRAQPDMFPVMEVTSCGFGEKRINWEKPTSCTGAQLAGERKCMYVIPPGCVTPPHPPPKRPFVTGTWSQSL